MLGENKTKLLSQIKNPFTISDSARFIEHPETPSPYLEWREIFPLLGKTATEFIGNLLGWSYPQACITIGSSRKIFDSLFKDINDDILDDWMASLLSTPANDFFDFFIPFLYNYPILSKKIQTNILVERFLEYHKDFNDKKTIIKEFPEIVIVEITKSCNFSCIMCSSRTHGFKKELTMPHTVFGEIIRVFGPHASTIRINGYGETTIVPNLNLYLDCLDEFEFKGIREIITNLSSPKEVYRDIIQKDFLLEVSWDATEKKLFEKIRIGSDYDRMYKTLEMVGKELTNNNERFILLATIQERNVNQIVPLMNLANQVGAGMVIFNMVNEENKSPWMKKKFNEIKNSFQTAEKKASKYGIKIKIPDHLKGIPVNLEKSSRTSNTFCDRPWKEIMIRYDTEITVCNMFNSYSFGMLFHPNISKKKQNMEERFFRLWYGPNGKLFRNIINTPEKHPYCEDCYYI